jgi:hypothetical protein
MTTKVGADLAAVLNQRAGEIEDACAGLRGDATTQRPSPRAWCVREHLSHLYGADRDTFLDNVQRVVVEGVRELDIPSSVTHYSADRRDHPFDALVEAVADQYRALGEVAASLDEDQFQVRVRVEQLGETRFGVEPTLGQLLMLIADSHLPQHIAAIRETRTVLGA